MENEFNIYKRNILQKNLGVYKFYESIISLLKGNMNYCLLQLVCSGYNIKYSSYLNSYIIF